MVHDIVHMCVHIDIVHIWCEMHTGDSNQYV